MRFRDTLKNLTTRAQTAAAEHKDEIRETVQKAEAAADQQTGGKYHDKIEKAGGKADAYLEKLEAEPPPRAQGAGATEPPPPARPAPDRS